MNRWLVYQKERFPLLAHGPLIAAFSACAVSFSSLLRGAGLKISSCGRYPVSEIMS